MSARTTATGVRNYPSDIHCSCDVRYFLAFVSSGDTQHTHEITLPVIDCRVETDQASPGLRNYLLQYICPTSTC